MNLQLVKESKKQYFTLISLINHNLTKLEVLRVIELQSSNPEDKRDLDVLVVSTLSCLEASLSFLLSIEPHPNLIKLHNIQNLKVEFVRIYFNLAEKNLLKAIEICKSLPYLKPIELGILRLLVNSLIKQNKLNLANSLIKDNLDESIELRASDSVYYLLVLKINFLLHQGQFQQTYNYLDQLISHSKQFNHYEILILAKLYRVQINFQIYNHSQIEKDLTEIDELLANNNVNEKLILYLLILKIQFNLIIGNNQFAVDYLLKFHEKFELLLKVGKLSFGNNTDFTLNNVSRILPSGESVTMNPILKLGWLTKEQLFILGYLISANCQRNDTSTDRSKIFLLEGLKAIDAELVKSTDLNNIEDLVDNRNWLINIKTLILIQLSDSYLIKNDFKFAKQTLIHAIELTNTHNLWQVYMIQICISWAFYLQLSNKLEDAISLYDGLLELNLNNNQKSLILINKLWIVKGMGLETNEEIKNNYKELEDITKFNPNSNISQAFKLLKLIRSGESVEAKVKLSHLLDEAILNKNLPLQNLILLQLSNQYYFTNPNFSKELSNLSLKLSQFEEDHLLSLVNCQVLIELEKLNNSSENLDKVKELELAKDYHLKGLKFKLNIIAKEQYY